MAMVINAVVSIINAIKSGKLLISITFADVDKSEQHHWNSELHKRDKLTDLLRAAIVRRINQQTVMQ